MIMIGDGTGNEILVAGTLLAILARAPGVVDVTIPEDAPDEVEFGLDFMGSRYRVTVAQVPDQAGSPTTSDARS